MASYYICFEIKIEGTIESTNSIFNAIKTLEPKCEIALSKDKENVFCVENMWNLLDETDAQNYAIEIAKAANGANFHIISTTECETSGEIMKFDIDCINGKLVLRHSTWYYETWSGIIEGFETYEEFSEEYEEYTEEAFELMKENEFVYDADGEWLTEVPYIETIELDY